MTADSTDNRPDQASIEDEVRRTQDEIGETVNKLEEKLSPREITRSALGDDGADVAREALDVARQSPIPVALIAVGIIWLLATSRSPMIRRITERITGSGRGSEGTDAGLRQRSAEPAPIGPPPTTGESYDRRADERAGT
jgi:hypothetical protein